MTPRVYLKSLLLYLLIWVSAAARSKTNSQRKGLGSSVILPVTGNVYPKGYYHVAINVGQPPRPFFLDIDTGSDLTWLQCDAPCAKCIPAPHTPYKPNRNVIACQDPLCASLHGPGNHNCPTQLEQCDYEVNYADHGSSLGVLVKDSFSLQFSNGSTMAPHLAFGCGYNQDFPDSTHPPYTDGVLGLGTGKSSVLAQLSDMGVAKNVVGHCFSQRGGFIFFGNDFLPGSEIVWTSVPSQSKYYSLGSADLQFGGQTFKIKNLSVVFDSGSTYTYFTSQAYNALLAVIKQEFIGKQLTDAVEDRSLPVCWKGVKPFKSIYEAVGYFKPLTLLFTKAKVAQFLVQPEAYLIVSEHGNVCLGILNGSEVGLENLNVIGDISLQNKLVIYDNEKNRIGWAPANCDRLPNMELDRYEAVYWPHADNPGMLEKTCSSHISREKIEDVRIC